MPESLATATRWWEASEFQSGELWLPGQSRLDADGRALLEQLAARADHGEIDIPPMPKAALDALKLLRSGECDLPDVAESIQIDPVLTAQVLRLANSALFGARHTIDRVDQAVSYLGISRMRELVMSVALRRVTSDIRNRHYSDMEWKYSIHCAAIAKQLGTRFGVEPEKCYVAGLLKDIGRLPILRLLDDLQVLGDRPEQDSTPDIILEVLHRGVGLQVSRAWEQPPVVMDAVGNNITGRIPEEDGECEFPSTRIAEVAGDLCIALGLGRFKRGFDVFNCPSFQDLGFTKDSLIQFFDSELRVVLDGVSTLG